MKERGFANAPSVTAWAVGMEFQWMAARYRVLHTMEDGQCAVAILLSADKSDSVPYPRVQPFGRYEDRSTSTLDLSVPWVGREYYVDCPSDKVTVLMVSDDRVAYRTIVGDATASRNNFLTYWKPVPIDSKCACVGVAEQPPLCYACRFAGTCGDRGNPKYAKQCPDYERPEKCEGCDKPAVTHDNEGVPLCQGCADSLLGEQHWTPEVGKECLWNDKGTSKPKMLVTPLVNDSKEGLWVCRMVNRGTLSYHGIPTCLLEPLPPDPPTLYFLMQKRLRELKAVGEKLKLTEQAAMAEELLANMDAYQSQLCELIPAPKETK